MRRFRTKDLEDIYDPLPESSGEENGQVTIIGGSELFHGAPLLALKTASRIVDMVFFASPEKNLKEVSNLIKAELSSFIWVPWEEVELYVKKSDAVLIGPGFMRVKDEGDMNRKDFQDEVFENTRHITKRFLTKFPNKRWVIDAGSLQTMDAEWIPEGAILTPNKREFEMLFGEEVKDIGAELKEIPRQFRSSQTSNSARDDESGLKSLQDSSSVQAMAERFNCTIVLKGPTTVVCSPEECVLVTNGNAGLTKGGTGDVLAGLTAALYAKNDAFLAASAASYIAKAAGDELFEKVGTNYNADDLAERIPEVLAKST